MLLKKLLPLLFFVSIFQIYSCSNSDEIVMNFKLEYDGQPLVVFDDYAYPTGEAFNISRFSFYISDIDIVEDNLVTKLKDVDYLDLTSSHIDLESSASGYDYIIEAEDLLDFTGIRFNTGLPSVLNNTVPADYPSSSALSLTSEYWESWNSYIFMKIEGNIDLDADGSLETGIALHLGSDDMLRTHQFDNLDGSKNVSFVIDLKDIFESNGNLYDIATTPRIHSLTQINEAAFLMNNFQSGLRLE